MSGFEKLLQKFSGQEEYDNAELPCPPPSKEGSLEAFIQKFGRVTEEYSFYNGTVTLRFNVDEHAYYLIEELGNLILLDGVTNTVGIIDKSMMLTPWAAKMMAQKLLRIIPVEMVNGIMRIKPLTLEEFTTYVMEAKGAHKEKLDEAGDTGHAAHKCIEDSIRLALKEDPEKKVRKLINMPEDERACNCANSAKNWMDLHNVRWVETESKVYSREYRYAGTMDGLAYVDSCGNKACCPTEFKDRLSLIDWKSSNYLKIEYLFQTASYKHAKMEEFPDLKIIDTWILRLGKNEEEAGKFDPWHMTPEEYEEDFQGFLACLTLTRLVRSVEERMKGQKASIRAVRKEQRETAKALAKEQAKLQKALEKAAKKVEREAEKKRIKEEARAERERLKAEKKAKKNGGDAQVEVQQTVNLPLLASTAGSIPAAPTITEATCSSLSNLLREENSKLDTGTPTEGGLSTNVAFTEEPISTENKIEPTPCTKPEDLPITSTEEIKCTSTSRQNPDFTPLVSSVQTETGTPNQTGTAKNKQLSKSTTSTAEVQTNCALKVNDDSCFAYTPNLEEEVLRTTTPEQREAFMKAFDQVDKMYEEEAAPPIFNLPMEG